MKINNLEEIMNKKLSRKEFLLHIGGIVLAVSGISSAIDSMSKGGKSSFTSTNSKAGTYGYGEYSKNKRK